jgi:predicted HicB family RNase H-like nuclease
MHYLVNMDLYMPEETKDLTLTLRVKPSVKAKAVKLAAEEHRSLTNLIEHLIEQAWSKRK